METIQISVENAKKAHKSAGQKGKKLLENLLGEKVFLETIFQRIKSFDDVLNELKIQDVDFIESCEGLESDEVAYRKAKLVCKALNEGWLPDWENHSEYKYYPWFEMGSSSGAGFSCDGCVSWSTYSDVGSRLCFKSSELAEFAGKLFQDEIYKPLFI